MIHTSLTNDSSSPWARPLPEAFEGEHDDFEFSIYASSPLAGTAANEAEEDEENEDDEADEKDLTAQVV